MYLLYEINKPFIAENYCENKAKPQLQCEGQCFLNKNLKKETENNTSQKVEKMQKLIMISLNAAVLNHEFYGIIINTFFDIDEKGEMIPKDIFHPPIA